MFNIFKRKPKKVRKIFRKERHQLASNWLKKTYTKKQLTENRLMFDMINPYFETVNYTLSVDEVCDVFRLARR